MGGTVVSIVLRVARVLTSQTYPVALRLSLLETGGSISSQSDEMLPCKCRINAV